MRNEITRISESDGYLYVKTDRFRGNYVSCDVYRQSKHGWMYIHSTWTDLDFFTNLGRIKSRREEWEPPLTRKWVDNPSINPKRHSTPIKDDLTDEDKLRVMDKHVMSKSARQTHRAREWAYEVFLDCSSVSEFVRRTGGCPVKWVDDFQRINPKHIIKEKNRGRKSDVNRFAAILRKIG